MRYRVRHEVLLLGSRGSTRGSQLSSFRLILGSPHNTDRGYWDRNSCLPNGKTTRRERYGKVDRDNRRVREKKGEVTSNKPKKGKERVREKRKRGHGKKEKKRERDTLAFNFPDDMELRPGSSLKSQGKGLRLLLLLGLVRLFRV